MADNFPIDIDYKKVNDWMFERKKLGKDWVAKHKAVSLKLSDIFTNSTVEESIKQYMKSQKDKANYLSLCRALEKVLESQEGKAKNMFGGYTSKNVNDLLSLKKLYEKDNLHIADLARILSQNGVYEIPAIKKNLSNFEGQIQQLVQEEQTFKNSISHSEREFAKHCQKLGIAGEDINKEVPALIQHLPEVFDKFVETVKTPVMRETLDLFYNFVRYINAKQDEDKLKLSLLEHLYNHGDDLIELYELARQGKDIPETLKAENEKKYRRYSSGAQNKDQSSYYPQIIELDQSKSTPAETQQQETIDWSGFEVLPQTENKPSNEFGFEIIEEGKSNSPADIVLKDTILAGFDTRNQILANLSELSFFLKQRINESKANTGNTILQAYEEGGNQAILEVPKEKLAEYQKVVDSLTELLTNFQTRQYFILKEQPRASERIISHLDQFKLNANKSRNNLQGLSKRNYDINQAITENKEILNELIQQTTEIKTAIETEMKKLIKRDVYIIGDIKKILSGK